MLNSIGMKVRVVHLSGGKDPDEILRKFGPERVRSLIDGAANDIEYGILAARKNFDLGTSDGKMKYLDAVAEILAATKNNIAQDIYSSRLAEELSVSKESILARVNQIGRRKQYSENKNKFRKIQQEAMRENTKAEIANDTDIKTIKAEEMLIAILMSNPEHLKMVDEKLDAEDFVTDFNKRIFKAVAERLREGKSAEISFLYGELTDEEISAVAKIQTISHTLNNSADECADCIKVILNEKNKKSLKDVNVENISDEDFLKFFKN